MIKFAGMKTKEEIVQNWLPRYTGKRLEQFGKYILLTNFSNYVTLFARWHKVRVYGNDKPMQCATSGDITIINFGMGSPTAATVMDLLAAIEPKAVLFLGKCGGLKKRNKLGDLILPIAAIRGEGPSADYFPPEVPALPAFALQKAVSTTIRDYGVHYWTGTVYTTNRRVWEYAEEFKDSKQKISEFALAMSTATIFTVGFYNKIPTDALVLVYVPPMIPVGVQTEDSDKSSSFTFAERHIRIG